MKKPTTFFSAHLTPNETEAYEAGVAEGRRLERTLIKRWVANQRLLYGHDYTNLEKKLNSRIKPAKRKERDHDK